MSVSYKTPQSGSFRRSIADTLVRIGQRICLCLLLTFLWTTAASAQTTQCTKPFSLTTSGRYITDACGNRFKLKSVNWYGGSDTWQIPLGLDKQPIAKIVSLIQQMGFNSVRLQFSNQMIHTTTAVMPGYVAANPSLVGSTPLQVYDAVVKALTDAGIVVVLNNHTTYSVWCCGYDANGLWFGGNSTYSQTTQQWQNDWLLMVKRYTGNPLVAAVDLRNEVRSAPNAIELPNSPNWGNGDANDWRLAALQAGNQILAVQPHMLVIVEGVNWTGATGTLGGYRPLLGPVAANPIGLIQPNQLVYEEHSYGYIGPKATGNATADGSNPTYNSMDQATLYQNLDAGFGYVANNNFVYTAPVWMGEFGVGFSASTADQTWFAYFTNYLKIHDLDFAFWALNGTKTDGEEGFGLLTDDWSTIRNDWRTPYINALLQAPSTTGPVPADTFREADYGPGDDNQSATLGDWNSGATKATCPDGYHVAGASRYDRGTSTGRYRILCTNQTKGSLWSPGDPTSTQGPNESTRYRGSDWASGYTKYECPLGYFAAGASKLWWGTSGLLCAKANQPLGNTCRTVWFNNGDNRSSTKGGDWAPGAYKGQVADGEYVAGLAQTSGNAAALLACR